MNQKPHVISIPDAKKHLTAAMSLFRAGETEPLIIGTDGSPEAALIPYKQFENLPQDAVDSPAELIEFDDFAKTLDPELRARLDEDRPDSEDSDSTVERDFHQLLLERGFSSLGEFMIHTLKADRAEKRLVKLTDVSNRMWPNGAPEPGGES